MGIWFLWQRMRDSNPRKRSQSPVCYRYTNPLYPLGERSYYTQSFGNVKDNFWNFPDFFPAADLLPSKRNRTVLFRAERGGPDYFHGQLLAAEFAGFPWYSKATPRKCVCGRMTGLSPIRAVWKTGNTPSIPLFSKRSAEEKSLAAGSCRIARCCLKKWRKERIAFLRKKIHWNLPLAA